MRVVLTALLLVVATVARGDESATEKAEARYQQGLIYYNLSHWDAAIAEFERAYALHPAPEFIYNIAQARRLKGDRRGAVENYRAYLRLEPDSPKRADVERWIVELEAKAPPPAPAPAAAVARQDPGQPPLEPPPRRVWTWVAAGAAVALLVGGAAMWVATDRAYDDYQTAMTDAEWMRHRDRVETRQTWTRFLLGGAGATAATAGIFGVVQW